MTNGIEISVVDLQVPGGWHPLPVFHILFQTQQEGCPFNTAMRRELDRLTPSVMTEHHNRMLSFLVDSEYLARRDRLRAMGTRRSPRLEYLALPA